MATDTSKQCTITNNSGKDIVITLMVPDDEVSNNGSAVNTGGSLELLKITDGSSVIKKGSSGTVTLDHSYKPGATETGYVKDYDLVVSDSTWIYPIAGLPVAQQGSNGMANFTPQTIDTGSATAMAQAAAFYQTISVYPQSQLTKDYTAALESTKNATTADAIASTMDAFFKSTAEYKMVTLSDVAVIHDYYQNFPAVWAQYKDSFSYYLYSSDGTTPTFQGTVMLKKTGPLDATKPAGGYTCSFAPAITPTDTSKTDVDTEKAVALTYTDGLFVNDAKAAKPSVIFNGGFLLKSLFTNKEADTDILTVLSGNVAGQVCVGFDAPQPSAKKDTASMAMPGSAEEFWDSLIHPKSQQQIIISILMLCSAVGVVGILAGGTYAIYKALKNRPASPPLQDWDDRMQFQIDQWNARVRRLAGPDVKVEPLTIHSWEEYQTILMSDIHASDMIRVFEQQQEGFRTMLKYMSKMGPDVIQEIQSSLTSIHDSIVELQNTRPDELPDVLPQAYKKFESRQRMLKILDTNIHQKLTKDVQKLMDDALIKSDQMYDRIEESVTIEAKDAANREPVVKERIFPEW